MDRDLAAIMERIGRIANLLRGCYGDKDQRVCRPEEARAAVQRLIWAVERQVEAATRSPARADQATL